MRESRSSQAPSSPALPAVATAAAIEFLVLGQRGDDAYELATTHDVMDALATALGKEGTPDEYKRVAYYEGKQHHKAGKYWLVVNYLRALRLFLACGEAAVDDAIEVVGARAPTCSRTS